MESFICPRCNKSVWRDRDRNLVEYHGRMTLVCGKPCYMTVVVTPVDQLKVIEDSEGIGSFPIYTVRKVDREPWLKRRGSNVLSHKTNAVMILSTKTSIIEKDESCDFAKEARELPDDETENPLNLFGMGVAMKREDLVDTILAMVGIGFLIWACTVLWRVTVAVSHIYH